MRAPRVRAVFKPEALHQTKRMAVHLPTGGGMGVRSLAKNLGVAIHRTLQFSPRPLGILVRHIILPADMVITVDADFKTGRAYHAQNVRAFLADIRRGQQRAIQQSLDAVVLHHGGARYLAEKAGAEYALDGAPGVIRAEREEKSGLRVIALQYFNQTRHAFARSAIGVHIDLEGELFHIRIRD